MSQSASRARPLLAMVALNATSQPSLPSFSIDKAAVVWVPAPIPWSNLEGPCATAWWWPAATEQMQAHTSHLLVALGGDTGPLVLRYLTLTHLTATVASHTDAVGIYWPAGSLVHKAQVFIQQARDSALDPLPLHLWIDFRIESMGDGRHRLFTTGMRAFRQEEIEIPPTHRTPADLLDFATTIAQHIIRTNPEIGEENTIGRSEDEKVPAAYRPSMLDPTMTVLRLEY